MARIRIGKLRHRVTVQSRGSALDNHGLVTSSWTSERIISANVRSLSGRTLELARQRVADASLIVTIRRAVGLTTQHRLLFGDRILNIGAVVDDEELERFHSVYCSEEEGIEV